MANMFSLEQKRKLASVIHHEGDKQAAYYSSIVCPMCTILVEECDDIEFVSYWTKYFGEEEDDR